MPFGIRREYRHHKKLFREKALAYTIMQTDDEIDERVAASIAKHPDIFDVRIVKSDRASKRLPL